jgi:hypothetical protein
VASAIAILVLSCGAIVAGWGYVRTARRMRSFATVRGTVLAKEVAPLPGGSREGRWGKGGGSMPRVTYSYTVDGVAYTSDKWSYAMRGYKRSLVEQQLAELPDEVDVHYSPVAPTEAYLETHSPALGRVLVGGGLLGVLVGIIALLA